MVAPVHPADAKPVRMKRIFPFAVNFLYFAAMAFIAPFLVLHYQNLGFSGPEIGLLTGLTPFITLLSAPLWTGLADSTHRHRIFMGVALLVSTLLMIIFPLLRSFAPVLLLGALFTAFFAPISAFSDNATIFMLGPEPELYGRVRVGGTIGFGIAATVAGAVAQRAGLKFSFWGGAALLLLTLLVSLKLQHGLRSVHPAGGRDFRALLVNRFWILFLILAFAGGLSIAAINNYMFPFLRELGASESAMGFALTLGTISEMPVFIFGDRLIRRLGAQRLLTLAMVLSGLRLLLLAASNTPALVLGLQLLNGVCFPAMWMAGVSFAAQSAPPGMGATAQGMFGAVVFGFGGGVGGFAGGVLLERYGGHGLFLVFGIAVLAGVAIVTALSRGGFGATAPADPD